MRLQAQILQSTRWIVGLSYIGFVVSFLGNLALARLLAPQLFGEFALAGSLLSFVFMFSGFGSQEAIVQCRETYLQHFIATAIWISAFLGVALGLLALVVSLIGQWYFESIVIYLAIGLSLLFPIQIMADTYLAILKRNFQYKQIALISFFSTIISFAAALAMAYQGWGVWSLFWRMVIDVLIRTIAAYKLANFELGWVFDRQSARWIWSFGWRILFVRINEVIFGRFDSLLIGSYMGNTTLGHYSQAYRLANLAFQFTWLPISSIIFSTFSEVQKSPTQVRFIFQRLNYWLWRIVLLLVLLVACLGEALVVLVYGEPWRVAGQMFQALAIFMGLIPLAENIKEALTGTGQLNTIMVGRTIQITIFIPTVLYGAWLGNYLFIIYSITASLAISLFYLQWQAWRKFDLVKSDIPALPLLICLLIYLTWAYIAGLEGGYGWMQVLGHLIALSLAYSLLLLMVEFRRLLAEVNLIFQKQDLSAP